MPEYTRTVRDFMRQECPVLHKWAEKNIPKGTKTQKVVDYLNTLGKEVGFRQIDGQESITRSLREFERYLVEKEQVE